MSPQDRIEFEQMKATLEGLVRAENVAFIESIKRRLDIAGDVSAAVSLVTLNDLANVDVPSPTNGQVLKFTTSGTDRWVAAADNT
tara:strand:- start:828 stop:1082 length:255 start_codon:yes stop_codon:yes gene_type:complete